MWRPGMNFMDAQQQALAFLTQQLSIIEPGVIRTIYPDIQYPGLIPVDTAGNEWAKSITFFSLDSFGQAEWFHHMALDVPVADFTREKFEQGIEMAAIGYFYTLEELAIAAMTPGVNLTPERAAAARRAYEEFVDDKALRGDTIKGWWGLINYSGIQVIDITADGTDSSPSWLDKTPEQILRDFNSVLTGIYTASLQIELADTVLLPVDVLLHLAQKMINEMSTMTVLQWLRENNVYTLQTGRALNIRSLRGLETAGVSGQGRMVAYRNDPLVLKLHIPMPHRFLPVWQRGPMRFDVPGIFRMGGVEVRRPGAVRYADGVSVPAG